ncbi:TonB-dependent receptor [Sphingosinicella sp. LHD-64]|uniref:TonB-dependent receptor n=1 Tax=Sphingosinicella sp. LHD-64 TaxID=3072139 RepID=UPI00280EB626|nr:TonB-dependent receptor [Sphingosinicella sp. LHD-64]MDQ8754630.1 TonB-dependent receptor [Sphingosinicella sp. LHD-64]
MLRAVLFVSASLPAICLPAAASAQTAGDAMQEVEEIVVTGEKVDRSLQETTTSVAVITARRIEQENLQSLRDIFNRTANVSETYGAAGFTIRGIANNGVSSAGDAPLATVYLDGAALPSSILYGAPTDLWDVAQVEILRGPQSTLQGLNTLAGAVILRTADPGNDWNGRARLYLTDSDDQAYALAIGGPLVADELGVRIAAEYRDSDGFIRNVTRNAPEDPLETLNLRGVLRWTPRALPGLTARLSYTRFEREGAYQFVYVDTTVPDFFDHRTVPDNTPNVGNIDADIANLELTYDLSDAFTLTSVTSYNAVVESTAYDGDRGPANQGYGTQDRDYDTISQELRLAYESGRLSGLLGAFYYRRDQDFTNTSRTDVPTPVPTIAAVLQGAGFPAATATTIATLYAQALPVISVDYASLGTSEVETFAIFGDGRWRIFDQLSLIGGFRWDHEVNTTQNTSTAVFAGTYPNPAAFGAPGSPLFLAIAGINQAVGQFVGQAAAVTPRSRRTFDAFLPKFGLDYDFTDDLSVAFVVQRGYRSGGSSQNIARATVVPYDPEYSWNYELSLRSQWLDGALTLNANAFYIDWTDQQVSINFGLNLYDYNTVNAGSSHLYGFEVEMTHRPSRMFDWYVSIGHTRTEFDEFAIGTSPEDDRSGQEFPYAPRWTFAAGANLRFGGGFFANANASHRSGVFTDVAEDQSLWRVGSRTLVNARIGYEIEHVTISAFVNNLFDEAYIQYNAISLQRAVIGAPRVFGLTLEGRF